MVDLSIVMLNNQRVYMMAQNPKNTDLLILLNTSPGNPRNFWSVPAIIRWLVDGHQQDLNTSTGLCVVEHKNHDIP